MLSNLLPPRRMHEYRIVRERAESYHPARKQRMTESGDIYRTFSQYYAALDKEQFITVALDTKLNIIGWTATATGTINSCIVHPREVFKFALLCSAHAVIFLHNHPTGDPTPSEQDYIMTARLVEAGGILGIQVLDHVICGESEWYSFADDGRIRL